MRRFVVMTPEFETYSATEIEPPEYGCDYVEVEAETKRDARILGVRLLRALKHQYGRTYFSRYSDECPFAGLVVEDITDTLLEADGEET